MATCFPMPEHGTRNTSTRLLLPLLILPWLAASPLAAGPRDFLARPDDWFRSPAGREAAACVLSWQAPGGAWPKNTDTTRKRFTGERAGLQGTFDNGATTGELRFLARAFRAAGDPRCRDALLTGLDHLLAAQYPNGGWPQFHPPGNGYHRHITFNDDAMVRLLELLREVGGGDTCAFVDDGRRQAARAAFAKGIDCILKCQVVVNGAPAVWCAQHDERTLEPRPARAFEPAALSGCESAGILRLLMSLEHPPPEVVRAVEAGVAWFERSRITGIRLEKAGGDLRVVADPQAPPLWARFYQIDTNRPVFCGRDGVVRYAMAGIDAERRTGYAWYGRWGDAVAKAHSQWHRRPANEPSQPPHNAR